MIGCFIALIFVRAICKCYSRINYVEDIRQRINDINKNHINIINSKKSKYGPITRKLKIKKYKIKNYRKDVNDYYYDNIIINIEEVLPNINSTLILNYYNIYYDILTETLDIPQDLINIILDYLDNNRFIRGTIDNKRIVSGYKLKILTRIKLDDYIWLEYNSESNKNRMWIIYDNYTDIDLINQAIRYKNDVVGNRLITIKNPFGYVTYDVINERHSDNIKIDIIPIK